MSIYKRYSDKTICMYFTIKDEKNFNKYENLKKKFNSELI